MSKPNMGAMFGGKSMGGLFDIPFSMQRLNRHDENVEIRPGIEYEEGFFYKSSKNGKRVVRKLPLDVF